MGEPVTVRRSEKLDPLGAERVAELLQPVVNEHWPPENYREFMAGLSAQIAVLTGVESRETVLSVAGLLGVLPEDWFKQELQTG